MPVEIIRGAAGFEWDEANLSKNWEKHRVRHKDSFPNLKPSIKTISLRLPESIIEYLKVLAHKRDVPYQSLMKIFLSERIKKELHLLEV
ncbi:MAG: CopG family antitoxin [Candidatus Margulisiibacteriota bacterium]